MIIAAMRSPSGASAAILMAGRRGEITMLANVALALEYEATCRRPEHGVAAGLSQTQVGIFIDAVIALAEPVETHFLWRPQLRDPGDEIVLEAAVNGRAKAIVTFNSKDFGDIPPEIQRRRTDPHGCFTKDQTMSKPQSTYPLRLPTSVKAEVVRRAKEDGTSFNQFVATAVAEKLAAMNTAQFFLERRERANYAAFDKIMKRKDGEKPKSEDQLP